MIRLLCCICAFLLGATALQADVFHFTYSGPGVSTTGTLTANDSLIPNAYTVTGISGTRNGTAFNDSAPAGVFAYINPSNVIGELYFSIGSALDTLTLTGNTFVEVYVPNSGLPTVKTGSVSMTSTPEPGVLSLLFTMGFGAWFLSRKLPSRRD